MSWLRLQWRGALVVLAGWAGMAAAQLPPAQTPPAPQAPAPAKAGPASAPSAGASERIVTVNEDGKSTRCRIVQTWQLTDGSTAHQLQAIDTGEYITILDDPTAMPSGKGMPKRIFHWGQRRTAPPAGTPIPPELMVDSGVVTTREINPPPPGGKVIPGPVVVTQATAAPSLPAPGGPLSPYAIGVPGPSTPVAAVATGTTPNAAAGATSPYCGCTPAPVAVLPPARPTCPAGCDAVAVKDPAPPIPAAPPGPTLREKIQGWFAARSTPATDKGTKLVKKDADAPPADATVKVVRQEPATPLPAAPTKAPQKAVVQRTPPSSAQPTQAEVVAAPSKQDVAQTYSKVPTTLPVAAPAKPVIVQAAAKPNAPDAAADKADILATPEKFAPADGKRRGKVTPSAAATEPQADPNGLPPGSGSVLAARNGLQGPIAFVPVQTPVVPKPWRPPVPPDPKTPEAPQLNAFVNAFTPPPQAKGAGAPPMYGPPMAMGYPPPGMPPYAMMNPAAMPSPYAMPPYVAMNPYYVPQNLPPGYGYPVMPAGYGYPMPPAAMPGMPGMSPRTYSGPLPPDPFGTNRPQMPIQPVGYVQPVAYAPQAPTAPQDAMAPAAQIESLLSVLHDSAYPAQREMAANWLAQCDARAHPQVIAGLMQAARQDPAPAVRAGCVANLMRMNVSTPSARGLYEALRTDADPRVREAAEAALVRLGPAAATAPAPAPAAVVPVAAPAAPQTN